MKETIRIACGQGFWGDLLDAPVRQVEGGPLDYLMLDYLAEVTMSIMQKQRARDPGAGYARDFVPLMREILPACVARDIRVTANAGGVNLRNMDTGEPLSSVRERIQSANAYLGAWPMVEALRRGARVCITGRATDTGLTLAPLINEFGWAADDWDRLSAGTIAGHIIECGAQCSGGNCQHEWETIPDLANVGFPLVEAKADGTFVVTKHEGTGGRVSVPSVKEQLVYEMGDPEAYITPDCVADFTTIRLEAAGPHRGRLSGIGGNPGTEFFKVSRIAARDLKKFGTLVYA